MANQNDDLLISAGLDLDDWDKGIRDMVADERRIERVLDGVIDSVNDAEKALNDINGSINLDVDTSDLDKAKNIAEALGNVDATFDVNVDESELEMVRRLIADIDSGAPTVDIVVDESELDAAERIVTDLDGESPNVDVDVDDDEVDEALALLQQIRDMAVIDIVMSVGGNITSVVETLSNIPGIGGIVALDNAMASFEGRTGRSAFFLEGLIEDLHGQGIIAGAEQIGAVAEQAVQLGIHFQEVDDAAIATFNTIAVTGGDATETLTLINQMVDLGLADSFSEASDIIVTGFQTAANRGDDFLDVLTEYGSTFQRFGLDGDAVLSLINSGLEAGFGNADRVADALREMGIRVSELDFTQIDAAMTAFDSGQITLEELNTTLGETGTALNELDLLDETEAFLSGELSGEDYFNGVITALGTVEDEAERARLAVQIFGTQAEDIGNIELLTTEGVDVVEGRAQEAADAVANTIGASIAEVQQLLNDLATAFFSSDQLDIDGKLDDAKRRIQTFIDAINSGATFGEGLELALEMPGLEDQIRDLEGILGNFMLGFMQGLAGLLDILGQGGAALQLRETVASMADEQLIFDVAVADDAFGVAMAVTSAINRGMSEAEIAAEFDTAISEAIATGDFELARDLIDNIEVGLTLDTTGYEAQFAEATAGIQLQIDQLLTSGDVAGAAELAGQIGSSLEAEFTRLVESGNFNLAAILAAGSPEAGLDISDAAAQAGYSDEAVAEMEANAQAVVDAANETADMASIAAEETGSSLEDVAASTETFTETTSGALLTVGGEFTGFANTVEGDMGRVNTAIDAAIGNIGELIAAAEGMESISVDVVESSDSNGSAPGHMMGGRDSGTFIAGEAGREMVTTDTAMAILNNQTTESILSGLAALFSGGFGAMSGGSNVTINQNNTFNNSGAAASNASLDNAAKGIRGF